MKKYIIPFILLFSFNSNAVNKTAIIGGNWESASIWSPIGVPASTDNVTINGGITVNFNINTTITNITINGALQSSTSSSLTITGTWAGIGSFAGGTLSTVIFNPTSGSVTLPSTGTWNFRNISIATAKTLVGPATGSGFIINGGSFYNNGTYTHNNGTVYMTNGKNGGPGGDILGTSITTFNNLSFQYGTYAITSDIIVIGNLTVNSTTFNSSSTVTFSGIKTQVVGGAALNIAKLVVNKSAGYVNLSGTNSPLTVSNTLSLTSGRLQTGDNNLTYGGTSANITGPGWVETNGTGTFQTNTTGTFTYPVGNASAKQSINITNSGPGLNSMQFGTPSTSTPAGSFGSWYYTSPLAALSLLTVYNPNAGAVPATYVIAQKTAGSWARNATTFTAPNFLSNGSLSFVNGINEIALFPACVMTTAGTFINGMVNMPYNQTITVSGAALPLSLSGISGLPPGLTLSTSGANLVLSGIPTISGNYNMNFTYTDASGCTNIGSDALDINAFVPPTQPLGNRGMYFDGVDDYVDASTTSSTAVNTAVTNNSFSISAWVKVGKVTGHQTILSSWIESSNSANFIFSIKDGSPCLKEKTGIVYPSTAVLEKNKWTHVTACYDKTNITWYVNGVYVGLTLAANKFSNLGLPVMIGHSSGTTAFFKGEIDEIKVFNKVLSTAEVNTEMSSTTPTTNCVAYWDFEDDATTGNQTTAKETKTGTNSTLAASPATPLWALRVTNNQDNVSIGSLRWAISQANTDSDQDYIDFSIPFADEPPFTIGLSTDLPDISYPAIVDGYSQYGSKANTLAVGSDADLRIGIDGNNLVANCITISCTTSTTIIKGLVINNATSNQMKLGGANISILGNFIGTNQNGTFSGTTSSTANGIWATGANALLIGTVANTDRNVISGNGGKGITVTSGATVSPKIYNNYIGTNKDGITSLGSQEIGVDISGTCFNALVGGNSANTGNVIGGNSKYGIYFSGASYGNAIWNNKIGLGADGISGVSNNIGIYANTTGTASTNNIGSSGSPNIITKNITDGVVVDGGRKILIQTNSIYCNGEGAGISLKNAGNNNQAAPEIDVASITTISGTAPINSIIDIYKNTSICTITQGENWVVSVLSDGAGVWSYTGTFAVGDKITATATDESYNNGTSPFSSVMVVTSCNPLIVTKTTDSGPAVCGELRNAITTANNLATQDTIKFNITGTFPYTINLNAALPPLTDNAGTVIDGFSQSGSSENTVAVFDATTANTMNAKYGIILGNVANIPVGLNITSKNNVIKGLVLQNFGDATLDNNDIAINIDGNNNQVLGCIIGLDATGLIAGTNTATGIEIGGNNNIIGNGTPAGANLISGLNSQYSCIEIVGGATAGNTISGNMIGLLKDGTTKTTGTTSSYGISLAAGANIVSGNVISGRYYGISIGGNTSSISNIIKGNIIGLQANGTTYVAGNTQNTGVYITESGNTIGGSTVAERNIISGNENYGVLLLGLACSTNVVKGNYVGLNKTGTGVISGSSQDIGIYLALSASGNIIGGDATLGEANVVSGNRTEGITSNSDAIAGNTIIGNTVGPQADGLAKLASSTQDRGVLFGGSPNNVLGGTSIGHRNIISSNLSVGVYLSGIACSTNVIKGNYIGTDKTGLNTIPIGSQAYGIQIDASASNNTIGGTLANESNLIAFNTVNGIYATSVGTNNNKFSGNSIYSNTGKPINLNSVANNGKTFPTIVSASSLTISGTSAIGDVVEIYKNTTGNCFDATTYITSATADASGNWTAPLNLNTGDYVLATSRDGNNNTSEFSTCMISSTEYFWVGDGGNWSDAAGHWAKSSGGTTFHSNPPTSSSWVNFDSNSFSGPYQLIIMDINGSCKTINFVDTNKTPSIIGTGTLSIGQ